MGPKNILIVEDERAVREMIAFGLRRSGFETAEAMDAQSARVCIAKHRPDLTLLDWMLPDMSGLELARVLKADRCTAAMPIIMLTARAEEQDKVMGLDSGADDYMTKPFSPRELIARINAVLRRSVNGSTSELLKAEGLMLDARSYQVSADGHNVQLGPSEYRLLSFFMSHPERVYTRAQLMDHVWGGNACMEKRSVDVHIRRLREALEPYQFDRFVQTVYGTGYRFSTRR
jgi:two-component system, OmpR family, phosphate regulon response regulator PhoB